MIMMGDRKKAVAAILGPKEGEEKKPVAADSLQSIAEEVMDCIKAGDASGLSSALKAFFAECDSEPHVEGEHLNEE